MPDRAFILAREWVFSLYGPTVLPQLEPTAAAQQWSPQTQVPAEGWAGGSADHQLDRSSILVLAEYLTTIQNTVQVVLKQLLLIKAVRILAEKVSACGGSQE